MDMTVRQMKELIKWAKKEGIIYMEISPDGAVKVQFPAVLESPGNTEITDMKGADPEPTEEDVLFWSSK